MGSDRRESHRSPAGRVHQPDGRARPDCGPRDRLRRLAGALTASLSLLGTAATPALALPMLDYDLSAQGVVALETAAGDYSVTLDSPFADPAFTFSTGDVIHMQGRTIFEELFGGATALVVFTSFREAPSVACGGGSPPPRLAASPGPDLDPGDLTHHGSAVVSDPDGTLCSTELGGQPFFTLVLEGVTEGEEREFAFDLVLDGPMDPTGGMRVLYKGYTVVPEPSTAFLLAMGLPMLTALGRRH